MLGFRAHGIPWLFWVFEKSKTRFHGRLRDKVAVATEPRPGQLVWQWWEESIIFCWTCARGLLVKGFYCFENSLSRADSVRGEVLARNLA